VACVVHARYARNVKLVTYRNAGPGDRSLRQVQHVADLSGAAGGVGLVSSSP
jgi:hypothetical protein